MADTVGTILFAIVFGMVVLTFLAIAALRAVNLPIDLERAPHAIQSWAQSNGYKIRASENKSMNELGRTNYRGPFIGTFGGAVFRVVVTKHGEDIRRVAWIRVGDDFKVIWEDEWRPSEPPVG